MIYVLTVIGLGTYMQLDMPDPATCRVYQAENVARGYAATCEWVRYVAA